MTENELLENLLHICEVYEDVVNLQHGSGSLSDKDIHNCKVYLAGKLVNEIFDRTNTYQWKLVKDVLYERLEKKSPQTMFELTLGLPNGVGTVVLDELVYGRMYYDSERNIGLRTAPV